MREPKRLIVGAIGALVIVTAAVSPARAGCVDLPTLLTPHMAVPQLQAWLAPAASYAKDEGTSRPGQITSSIVGMWQFTFTSKGNNTAPFFIPDGAPLDAGYTQWHSDQTEIMNSSRDPATSNFCLGTWESASASTYKLNHFALSWDNTGHLCTPAAGAPSCFLGPANIREQVTIDRDASTYSGTVTIDQYDTQQNLLFHLQGTVAARRVTP
jgi:hypothetical protein